MPFTVIDLAESGWERGEREPGGDESKRWFIPPAESPLAGRKWLFKRQRPSDCFCRKSAKIVETRQTSSCAATIGQRRFRSRWRS
jgi:hypothetical protein